MKCVNLSASFWCCLSRHLSKYSATEWKDDFLGNLISKLNHKAFGKIADVVFLISAWPLKSLASSSFVCYNSAWTI